MERVTVKGGQICLTSARGTKIYGSVSDLVSRARRGLPISSVPV